MTKTLSTNGNGHHPSAATIATHRVVHKGQDNRHLARIDPVPVADDSALVACLSELVLAVLRQARLDAQHQCSPACLFNERRTRKSGAVFTSRRVRRDCKQDQQSAKRFLARLRAGYVPTWIAEIASAARARVASSPLDCYMPRPEKTPLLNGHTERLLQ